jgi:dihydroorotate dehydrogenase (NAD+) catalytic subunit
MNLNIKLGNLELKSPLVCASGTFGFGEELLALADFKSIGAFIAKTITLEPRAGNPPPRIFEAESGVLNSVGLENPGLEAFLKDKLPKIKKIKTPGIISVGGFSFAEYQAIVSKLDSRAEIKAMEINLSCPNLQMKKIISQDAKLTGRLVKSLRKLTKKTLIVKITPEVTDITEIAKALEDSGADAVSLVNTFLGMSINIDTHKPRLGNIYGGYSGPAIKPMALYRVWKVANTVKIPILGGGGIRKWEDAIEFFLAGASAISLGTINMVDPTASKNILEGIKNYMIKHKINSIDEFKDIFDESI